jgi:hypothetical protein
MTVEETKALIKTLRECGVTRYKTPEIELDLGPEPIKLDAPSPAPVEIVHKVEERTSLLKLSDSDLVDRLFPDHTNNESGEESAETEG